MMNPMHPLTKTTPCLAMPVTPTNLQRPDSGEAKLASFQDTVEATLMFVESYLMMHRRNEVCFVACTGRER